MSLMLYRTDQSSSACRTVSVSTFGSRTVSGSEFHRLGPETAKRLCPYFVVRERGTSRSPRVAERRWLLPTDVDTGVHSSERYVGAARLRHLYTRTHTLTHTRTRSPDPTWGRVWGVVSPPQKMF